MLSRSQLASVPLLPLTLCFAAGIILYSCGCSVWVDAVFLAIAALLFLINRYFGILSLCVCAGFASAVLAFDIEPDPSLVGKSYFYKAHIEEVTESVSSQRLDVTLIEAGDSLDLQPIRHIAASLTVPGFDPEFSRGETIVFKAALTANTAMRDLPDEIDPADFLVRRNIHLGALITGNDIREISAAEGFIRFVIDTQRRIIGAISQSALDPATKSFVIASLFGASQTLGETTRAGFQKAGIAHVLAVSGLHVGIIAFMVSILLWPLFISGYGRLRWVFVALAVWAYVLVTGFSPSATRAAIMASAFVVGRLLHRANHPVNSLCLAALVILVFDPGALFEIGFQLSFAAVLSILLFAGRLNPVSPRHTFLHAAVAYISVSLCAMLGTGVLSVIYFHSFPVYFLLSNIAVSLLLPFVIGGGLIIIVADFCGLPCGFVCNGVDLLCAVIFRVTAFVSSLPGSSVDGVYLREWIILPLLLTLMALKYALDSGSRKSWGLLGGAVAVFGSCVALPTKGSPEPTLYLTRDKQHSEIVYVDSCGILNIVTNQPNEPVNVTERAKFRFSDFMLRRGIDSLRLDTCNRLSDRLVSVGQTNIGFISGKRHPVPECKLTYAILSKGFRGEIDTVVSKYSPDTIVLAYDIHPRRALRYVADCRRLSRPYVWCREGKWSMSYDSSVYPRVK